MLEGIMKRGKKLKMKDYRKVEEIGIIPSIDLYKIEMMLQERRKRRRRRVGTSTDMKFCINIRD
jgi:hypothetical protein